MVWKLRHGPSPGARQIDAASSHVTAKHLGQSWDRSPGAVPIPGEEATASRKPSRTGCRAHPVAMPLYPERCPSPL